MVHYLAMSTNHILTACPTFCADVRQCGFGRWRRHLLGRRRIGWRGWRHLGGRWNCRCRPFFGRSRLHLKGRGRWHWVKAVSRSDFSVFSSGFPVLRSDIPSDPRARVAWPAGAGRVTCGRGSRDLRARVAGNVRPRNAFERPAIGQRPQRIAFAPAIFLQRKGENR